MHKHFIKESNGKIPWHGRFYLYFGQDSMRNIGLEWVTFSRYFGFNFTIDHEGWNFGIRLLLFSLYLSFENFSFLNKISPKRVCCFDNKEFLVTDEREFSISVYDWMFSFIPWGHYHSWGSKDPWWVRGICFDIKDFLFGKMIYLSKDISERRKIVIPMPEGCYDGEMVVQENIWKRLRFPFWPFILKRYYCDIKIPQGVPFNGKGENSWDCGIDGLFSISFEIDSLDLKKAISKAIGRVVEHVTYSRLRHGTPSTEELDKWRNQVIDREILQETEQRTCSESQI